MKNICRLMRIAIGCARCLAGSFAGPAVRMLICLVVGFSLLSHAHAQVGNGSEEAAPVENLNCEVIGSAHIFLPYLHSCLRFGGELRTRYIFREYGHSDNSATVDSNTRARLYVDSWSPSEMGTIRTYARINGFAGREIGHLVDKFFIRIGHFQVGRFDSIANLNYGSYDLEDSSFYASDNTVWMASYSMILGDGIIVTKAIEQPVGYYGDRNGILLRPDNYLPDMTLNARFAQSWWEMELSGGLHMNQTKELSTFDGRLYTEDQARPLIEKNPILGSTSLADSNTYSKLGWFTGIGAEFNLTSSLKAGLTGFYTEGALYRIGIGFPLSDSTYVDRRLYNSYGYNMIGGLSYDFNPLISFNFNGGHLRSFQGKGKNDSKMKSYLLGTSVDFRLTPGTVVKLGGRYNDADYSKLRGNFTTDSDGHVTGYSIITQIRKFF